MKIAIACDHAAIVLKDEICRHLNQIESCAVIDLSKTPNDRLDYTDYARLVCEKLQHAECDFGLLFCGTGIGVSIAANKMRGIRAALCNDIFTARLSREHNDANVLCMGARVVGGEYAKAILDTFLAADFLGGRHSHRVDKIMEIEAMLKN